MNDRVPDFRSPGNEAWRRVRLWPRRDMLHCVPMLLGNMLLGEDMLNRVSILPGKDTFRRVPILSSSEVSYLVPVLSAAEKEKI